MEKSVLDPAIPYFETSVRGITRKELTAHYRSSRNISMKEHSSCCKCKELKVSSRLVLNLLQFVVIKLSKKERGFPIKRLLHFSYSMKSSKDNPIYLGEGLLFKVQIKNDFSKIEKITEFVCGIEIIRIKDSKVVMSAPVTFKEFVLKRSFKKQQVTC